MASSQRPRAGAPALGAINGLADGAAPWNPRNRPEWQGQGLAD
ncbi:hypothetical protein [Kamptonema formosum]|nr:hypothetical protein [Oscillatoria sp. PCC 10802]